MISLFAAEEASKAAISEVVTPVTYPYTQLDELLGSSNFSNEAVSADNRFVVFTSDAYNLVSGDTDSHDVFVKDLEAGTIELVSRPDGSTSAFSSGYADNPVISANGRYVAFQSDATDLVAGAGTAVDRIYVRDLQTDDTVLASLADGGSATLANDFARFPSISADGSRVAFFSNATNLRSDDNDSVSDVYVRDIPAEDTLIASVTDGDQNPTTVGAVEDTPAISGDGNKVAFGHDEALAPGAPNGQQIYVRNLSVGSTTWVSREDTTLPTPPGGYDEVFRPAINFDGNVIAFESGTESMDPAHLTLPNVSHVYVRNVSAATTRLASLMPASDSGGDNEDFGSGGPTINDDGTVVGFTNFYFDGIEDTFLRSLYSEEIGQASAYTAPAVPDFLVAPNTGGASVSPDGSAIVFSGSIADVDAGDTGNTRYFGDLFIRGAGDGMPPRPFVPQLPGPPTAIIKDPNSPPPPPATSGAKFAAKTVKAGRVAKLSIKASEAGTLTGTFLKGKKKLGSFKSKLKAGKNVVKVKAAIKGRKLKPGKYKVALAFKASATGLSAKQITLALKVVK